MKLKIAFAGFRHGHIMGLYKKAQDSAGLEIVAACEEDEATRLELQAGKNVEITHSNIDQMLATVPCDIVAVGDYYSKRGSILIRSLKAGKHVIADKPICTCLDELAEIEKLAADKNLQVGCQLDLRSNLNICGAKEIIKTGVLGEIHAIKFGGQHPLLQDSRPGWYFEDGKHGGTINDIAIHGIDIIPWMTGLIPQEVTAARTWNALATNCQQFNDGAQFMLKMTNGCGVMGDVSYFAPDSCGFQLPYYWRFTIWGSKGVLEFNINEPVLKLAVNGSSGISQLVPPVKAGPDYLNEFIGAINGKKVDLNTKAVITAARRALTIQKAADQSLHSIQL